MDDLTVGLFETQVEKAISNFFDLVLDNFFGTVILILVEIFGFNPLEIDIRLQFDDFKHFSLEHLETIFELLILLGDPLEYFFS
jgi:hypothetical protein